MKVSLIIPVYNEARHLLEFLQRVDALELGVPKELVIVNDCSTDGTTELLKEFFFASTCQLIHLPHNQGKGAAISVGIGLALGEVIGIQDADFEYDMRDISALIRPLLDDRAEVVYGSRYKKSGGQVHRTYHYLINRFLTFLSNICSGLYFTDMETCYKFFKREVITNINLESKRFGFEPEITAKLSRLKLRIFELPISYFPRSTLQGKKISWRDGVAAIWHILYFNFVARPSTYLKPGIDPRFLPGPGHWL